MFNGTVLQSFIIITLNVSNKPRAAGEHQDQYKYPYSSRIWTRDNEIERLTLKQLGRHTTGYNFIKICLYNFGWNTSQNMSRFYKNYPFHVASALVPGEKAAACRKGTY